MSRPHLKSLYGKDASCSIQLPTSNSAGFGIDILLNVVRLPGIYKNMPDFKWIIMILMTTLDFLCWSQTIPQISSIKSFYAETQVLLLPHRFKMENNSTCVPSSILVSSPTIAVTWMLPDGLKKSLFFLLLDENRMLPLGLHANTSVPPLRGKWRFNIKSPKRLYWYDLKGPLSYFFIKKYQLFEICTHSYLIIVTRFYYKNWQLCFWLYAMLPIFFCYFWFRTKNHWVLKPSQWFWFLE